MGYTPKDKLTKIHIGDTGLVAKLPSAPKVTGKTSSKAVVSKIYAKPLISAFEQANIEVTADRLWGDVSVEFYERPIDTASLLEVFAKLFARPLFDTTQSSDLITNKSVYKVLLDVPSVPDIVSKDSSKVLSDTFSKSDIFSRVFNAVRIFNDTTDQAERVIFNSIKAVNEVADVSDILVTYPLKVLLDTTNNSDVFSRVVTFNRSFVDVVDSTDDFYGVMNVDDDQTAWVDKRLVDYGTLSERFSKVLQNTVVEIHRTALSDERRLEPQIVKADTFTRTDTLDKNVNKVRIDTSATSELKYFVVDRVYNEEAIYSETNRKSLEKPFLDSTSDTDLATLQPNKTAIDIVDQVEQLIKSLSVARSELADTLDTLYKAFETGRLDTAQQSDLSYRHLRMVFNEVDYFLQDYVFEDYTFKAVHLSDQITDFKFYKVFNDIVDSTDDFYGETNVDDDQIAHVAKYAAEIIRPSEVFSRTVTFIRSYLDTFTKVEVLFSNVNKVFADIFDASDAAYKSLSKIFSDTFLKTDIVALLLGKALSDSVSNTEYWIKTLVKSLVENKITTEVIAKIIQVVKIDLADVSDSIVTVFTAYRTFTEQTSNSENVAKYLGKQQNDTVAKSELFVKSFNKVSSDSVANSEVKIFNYSKIANDTVDATDDFYGAANLDDDQITTVNKYTIDLTDLADVFTRTVSFVRSFTETLSKSEILSKNTSIVKSDTVQRTDTITRTLNKVANDTAHPSEIKSANLQSYFLENYVVPGYVGTNYTL